MRFTNIGSVISGVRQYIENYSMEVADYRRQVAEALTEELFKNIPVWSGRTIRSITWSNAGQPVSAEPHPDRGGTASDGFYRFHQEFGFTNTMSLGEEPQRDSAEAKARATLGQVVYDIEKRLYVTASSTAWGLIERGLAPDTDPHRPRNKGVVSVIAANTIRAKFKSVK